jgi:nucleotide-binding universal stress UspA family protein
MINILVPLDGSELAERALPYATRLARAVDGRVTLVRASWVYPFQYAQDTDELPRDAQRVTEELADAAATLRRQGVAVETHLASGEPHKVIEDAARGRRADLIVMSTHGRGGLGRWVYGSVAAEVLRHAGASVLLVPAACDHEWPTDRRLRVLVPLDGSDLAEEVLTGASALAAATGAELVLVRVVDPGRARPTGVQIVSAPPSYVVAYQHDPEAELTHARHYLEDVAERLHGAAPVRSVRAEVGAPSATIAAVARDEGVDLIAMATHGRGGLSGLLMGSTAAATLQRAGVPVLLVRPAAARQLAVELAPSDEAAPVMLDLTHQELALVRRALERAPLGDLPGDPRALLARLERDEREQSTGLRALARS